MRIFTLIFWILIILIGIGFAVTNSRSVEIHYFIGKIDIYLPLLMLLNLIVGAFLGVIAMLPKVLKLKSMHRKFRQQIKHLEDNLHALRPTQEETE